MRSFILAAIGAAALSSAIALAPAAASADVASLVSDSSVDLEARRRNRRSVPEFDATAAGAIGVLLAGAALVIARRKKNKA